MTDILRVDSDYNVYMNDLLMGVLATPIQTEYDHRGWEFREYFDATPRCAVGFVMYEPPRTEPPPKRPRRTLLDLGLRRPR